MRKATLACVVLSSAAVAISPAPPQPALGYRNVPLLHIGGLTFKDLNRNGRLDPYEDWRLTPEVRARDLVARMTLEELAGLMVHGTAPAAGDTIGRGTEYDLASVTKTIQARHVNTFITRLSTAPAAFAEQNNRLQQIGEDSRLGVPVTISTDPRSSFLEVVGASNDSGQFSKWPETTGLAAIGSPALVRSFADIVRREYRAVGIRESLAPQADLATEPRWPRLSGTFGEDAEAARSMVEAYVEGMQNGTAGLNAGSVMAVVKHWVGYGAQREGFDSHNSYGRTAVFPGNNFSYHLIPFTGAFAAHVAAVMPTYSILQGVSLDGQSLEPVGGGFNRQLLTGLLRGTYHFDGVILSDWAITNDCDANCRNGSPAGQPPSIAMPWGVESLTKEQRFAKAIDAGVDQIGGTEESNMILDGVRDGLLTRARLEESAYRILLEKFELGLFEDAYVDPAKAAQVVGDPEFRRQGIEAQKRALVLLRNKDSLLPLKAPPRRVYLYGVDRAVAERHGFTVVSRPEQAEVAIIRADAPSEELHPAYFFGSRQHEGRLEFRAGDAAYDALVAASAHVPTIFAVYLDRPAILTNVVDKAGAVLGDFGIGDDALLDVLAGATAPAGHLPFELPFSMAAVRAQREDVPHDSMKPLFPYGYGLTNFGR